jgi:hypothetical protein
LNGGLAFSESPLTLISPEVGGLTVTVMVPLEIRLGCQKRLG